MNAPTQTDKPVNASSGVSLSSNIFPLLCYHVVVLFIKPISPSLSLPCNVQFCSLCVMEWLGDSQLWIHASYANRHTHLHRHMHRELIDQSTGGGNGFPASLIVIKLNFWMVIVLVFVVALIVVVVVIIIIIMYLISPVAIKLAILYTITNITSITLLLILLLFSHSFKNLLE